jgi:iron complex transport system substrate-binding protein
MRRPTVLAALLCAALFAACGSDDEAPATAPAAQATTADAFPVTIEHRYGSTTIEKQPERVVVVGLREQDALLALGVVPVATTEWFGKHPGAIFPWATDELGGAPKPTVLTNTDGTQIEKVAAQRPDLIIGIYSGLTQKEYDQLSQLAPTIAQPKGQVDYGSSWQDEQLMTGKAVGQAEKAQALVDQTEQLIADTAAANPQFKGQTAANITDYQGIFVYGPEDVRTRTLEQLGFTYPQSLTDAFKDKFGGQLSEEKTDAVDVDVLVWFADGDRSVEELKDDAVYSKLRVRKEGRDVFVRLEDRVYEAMSFPSVLSMPTLMKELTPRLAAAADGDPSTSTDQR